MDDVSSQLQRRPASLRIRVLLVIYTVVIGYFGYVALSGRGPFDPPIRWIAGGLCLLLLLQMVIQWFEATRVGFGATRSARILTAVRLVVVVAVFGAGVFTMIQLGLWFAAAAVALLGGLTVYLLLPRRPHPDMNVGMSRPDPELDARGTRLVRADELEVGMRIVVGARADQLYTIKVTTVGKRPDAVTVIALIDAAPRLPEESDDAKLTISKPPGALLRVLNEQH